MIPETVMGHPALFRLIDGGEIPVGLSVRESRLLVGSLNFHAAMAPGRDLRVHVYEGALDLLPRTTDDATFSGLSRAFGSRSFSLTISSVVSGDDRVAEGAEGQAAGLVASNVRHVSLSGDAVLAYDPPRELGGGRVRRALRALRTRAPLLYDEARDLELRRHRGAIHRPAMRRDYESEFEVGGHHAGASIVPAADAPAGARRAVLFGLHWFELGGAERWAFESVRVARDAGFLPVVLTNRDSHQAWIGRPELDGALLIPFSEPTVCSQTPGVEELLRALMCTFDVRGVMVHHNQWLYDRLHWIARSRPGLPIIDSTHIIEYRGGGFPLSSVRVDEVITAHHVISPSLQRWMTEVQGVPADKVAMAPLVGLTIDDIEGTFREPGEGTKFTVAFVGRMARQKAPEIFVAMAHRLSQAGNDYRYIMHGDGEMSSWVDDLITRYGLSDVVERRDSSVAVSDTLREADLLVVTSHNEGLTLTTLEALAHGVPVVSTDVGAQSDMVPAAALFSPSPHRAVRESASLVAVLAANIDARRALWMREHEAQRDLLAAPTATAWLTEEIRTW